MALIESILARPYWRQKLWAWWYPFFTRRVRAQGIDFLNYAFETNPPLRIPLAPEDERNRPNIQLYHFVASHASLSGKKILEVSSGHGGGASYITRTFHPQQYIAMDLNAEAVAYSQKKHILPNLKFQQGDAMALPFADETFDVVINVEASHCYPDFARFLREVARVLKPGGCLLYADLRYPSGEEEWMNDLFHTSALRVDSMRLINPEVVRGMELNTERYQAMVTQSLPKFLHPLAFDFAGVKGSRLYRDAVSGVLTYRFLKLNKFKALKNGGPTRI